ncbi:peptidase inhibitor 16-like isoform X2 [Erpetoichthys calabaricus]|uniref:peptidase inhibitor 16-like isoform X2 n=1 Tax=Erpetoichthys calabaricus TaxID=27687 RepID=UPI0010A0BE39|nr:peptidase inhibitor 16-like isoform X2 [Erpetoichthys calabaricus]
MCCNRICRRAVNGHSGCLSEEEKNGILFLHNKLRGAVSPGATNMLAMSWNATLEDIATEYAKKCIWEHSEESKYLGENLYMTSGSLNVTRAVKSWFDEYMDYNFEKMECTPNKMCGHYTQVVWAESSQVGCGAFFCESVTGMNKPKLSILVCNYYPQGNYIGESPYIPGSSCSACPAGHTCLDALCEIPGVSEPTTSFQTFMSTTRYPEVYQDSASTGSTMELLEYYEEPIGSTDSGSTPQYFESTTELPEEPTDSKSTVSPIKVSTEPTDSKSTVSPIKVSTEPTDSKSTVSPIKVSKEPTDSKSTVSPIKVSKEPTYTSKDINMPSSDQMFTIVNNNLTNLDKEQLTVQKDCAAMNAPCCLVILIQLFVLIMH